MKQKKGTGSVESTDFRNDSVGVLVFAKNETQKLQQESNEMYQKNEIKGTLILTI